MDPNTPKPITSKAQYPNRPVRPQRRNAVSSSIFGGAVFDSSPGMTETPITPVIVQPGGSLVGPLVVGTAPRPTPPPAQMARRTVGGSVPIGVNQTTGATVFTGERHYQGQYGSSIFGGGISGMGDAMLDAASRGVSIGPRGGVRYDNRHLMQRLLRGRGLRGLGIGFDMNLDVGLPSIAASVGTQPDPNPQLVNSPINVTQPMPSEPPVPIIMANQPGKLAPATMSAVQKSFLNSVKAMSQMSPQAAPAPAPTPYAPPPMPAYYPTTGASQLVSTPSKTPIVLAAIAGLAVVGGVIYFAKKKKKSTPAAA